MKTTKENTWIIDTWTVMDEDYYILDPKNKDLCIATVHNEDYNTAKLICKSPEMLLILKELYEDDNVNNAMPDHLLSKLENILNKIDLEQCESCGADVVFESYEKSPKEYDVCDHCERHLCPDCFGGHIENCKDCEIELSTLREGDRL